MLTPLADAVRATCGGKAGALGALVRAGLPVPDGFVVPFAAHLAAARDVSTTHGDARPAPTPGNLPPALLDAIAHRLHALGDGPVAVRSSAGDEDGAHASAAGQYRSVLGVRGVEQVADAVRACWTSLRSPQAVAYRDGSGPGAEPVMAVLVQRLVDADVAGVMFTADGPAGVTVVEASWGLGPSVVGGTVTPDAYRVAADGSVTAAIADKRTRVDRRATHLVTGDVAASDRARRTLDDAAVARLARLGRRVAAVLGGPQDVEWAMVDDELHVLQARPVTADLPASARPAQGPSPATLVGTPGSRGTATGAARIVRGPGDFARVRPGDVLVCPWTDPAWTPLLRLAAGVVTETGGVLSHAAIVARERGIPAVLGIPGATTRLHDARTLTVDGTAGTVTTHT
ncbi:PEP/pyruvate-binding domain-containing protein [Cellulomonas sp. S1-8]|uniref:PEP/pyruvate-binding domain-containing protein n=1 Tax=Cellulomonas sp. S1-8 TaxID=2904790 RepID=UPI002243E422|nr:PEP/pyruvate-binding domain-containing protein [Cellulomonas sp. S1-8]UZN03857.1 PEP-utilizing enzyme [Cellulomonas sp. S1-8]